MKKFYFLPLIFIVIPFLNQAQNVGIGEASPSTKLEIKGDGSDLLNVKDNSNDSKLFINSSGDIGVGTTSPSEKLDVAGNIEASGSMTATSSKSITYPEGGYLYESNSSHSKYIVIWLPDNSSLRMMMNIKASFYRYSTEDAAEMIISGYSYPPGPSWVNTSFSSEGNENINTAEYIVSPSGRFGIVLTNNGAKVPLSYSHFVVEKVDVGYDSGNNFNVLKDGWEIEFADTYPAEQFKLTQESNMRLAGNLRVGALGSGVLSSDASGNITSGNISWGNISGVPGDKWSGNDNTTDAISRTGNVTLGDLTVSGDDISTSTNMRLNANGGYIDFRANDSQHGLILRDFDGSSTSWGGIRVVDSDRMEFTMDGGSYGSSLVVKDNDRVGIGTTSPSYELDVVGSVRARTNLYVGTGGGYFYNDNGSRVRINQDFYTNNSNTYLYANNLYLGNSSGDNIRMRDNTFTWEGGSGGVINSSGNVGIGNTSPARNLHVSDDVRVDGNDGIEVRRGLHGGYNQSSPSSSNWGANIWSIGTSWQGSGYGSTFDISGGSSSQYGLSWMRNSHPDVNSFSTEGLHIYRGGTLAAAIGHAGAYFNHKMAVDGDVSIGSTSAGSYKLYVNGKIGTNGINEISDRRFKKDIQPLEGSLDKLLQLQGVSYHWRHDEFPDRKFEEGKDIGVIAQEIEKIFPELVKTDNEGYKAVEYSHLVPVLIEAIKEQQEIIDSQKEKNLAQAKINNTQDELMQDMLENIEELNASIEILKQSQEMTSK